ncbi:unnamed protein product [Amoebophrya sp. A120]|nr:unnamed protein product [Amoebophrya sp. A120]|eukprot:GSA120T00009481001.1
MSSLAAKRLHQERVNFKKKRPFGFFARYTTNKDGSQNMMKWRCGVKTEDDGPWKGATVELTMEFSEDYPGRPPKVMLCLIEGKAAFHPNIYPSGAVCLSILNEDKDWRPTLTVTGLLTGIKDLLHNPNPDSPAQEEAFKVYIKEPKHDEWLKKVEQQAEAIKSGKAYEGVE